MSKRRTITMTITEEQMDWLYWQVLVSYVEDCVSSDPAEKRRSERFWKKFAIAWDKAGVTA